MKKLQSRLFAGFIAAAMTVAAAVPQTAAFAVPLDFELASPAVEAEEISPIAVTTGTTTAGYTGTIATTTDGTDFSATADPGYTPAFVYSEYRQEDGIVYGIVDGEYAVVRQFTDDREYITVPDYVGTIPVKGFCYDALSIRPETTRKRKVTLPTCINKVVLYDFAGYSDAELDCTKYADFITDIAVSNPHADLDFGYLYLIAEAAGILGNTLTLRGYNDSSLMRLYMQYADEYLTSNSYLKFYNLGDFPGEIEEPEPIVTEPYYIGAIPVGAEQTMPVTYPAVTDKNGNFIHDTAAVLELGIEDENILQCPKVEYLTDIINVHLLGVSEGNTDVEFIIYSGGDEVSRYTYNFDVIPAVITEPEVSTTTPFVTTGADFVWNREDTYTLPVTYAIDENGNRDYDTQVEVTIDELEHSHSGNDTELPVLEYIDQLRGDDYIWLAFHTRYPGLARVNIHVWNTVYDQTFSYTVEVINMAHTEPPVTSTAHVVTTPDGGNETTTTTTTTTAAYTTVQSTAVSSTYKTSTTVQTTNTNDDPQPEKTSYTGTTVRIDKSVQREFICVGDTLDIQIDPENILHLDENSEPFVGGFDDGTVLHYEGCGFINGVLTARFTGVAVGADSMYIRAESEYGSIIYNYTVFVSEALLTTSAVEETTTSFTTTTVHMDKFGMKASVGVGQTLALQVDPENYIHIPSDSEPIIGRFDTDLLRYDGFDFANGIMTLYFTGLAVGTSPLSFRASGEYGIISYDYTITVTKEPVVIETTTVPTSTTESTVPTTGTTIDPFFLTKSFEENITCEKGETFKILVDKDNELRLHDYHNVRVDMDQNSVIRYEGYKFVRDELYLVFNAVGAGTMTADVTVTGKSGQFVYTYYFESAGDPTQNTTALQTGRHFQETVTETTTVARGETLTVQPTEYAEIFTGHLLKHHHVYVDIADWSVLRFEGYDFKDGIVKFYFTALKAGTTQFTLTAGGQSQLYIFDYTVTVTDGAEPASEYCASVETLCEWAVNDYAQKNGIRPNADCVTNPDGTLSITLSDDAGNVLTVYTIDPVTGTGNATGGEEINLPQTGVTSPAKLLAVVSALLMMFCGAYAVKQSGVFRRKEQEF